MAEVCPIASPGAGELRYIERSAWGGVAQGSVDLAEEVGHTLAVFASERRIQHSLGDLELMGLVSPDLGSALHDKITQGNMLRVERFLGRLGYYGTKGGEVSELVPVLDGQHIRGICFDKGYDTLALDSDKAVATMHADVMPMGERKANMLAGLVIISGSDAGVDPTGRKQYDPLVVLPPLPVTPWRRIKHLSAPTAPLISPAEAKHAEDWARTYYRSELLSRITDVGRFLEEYHAGPRDTSSNARDRVNMMSNLRENVAELLLQPSLNSRHYVRELGIKSMACTGVVIYAYDQSMFAAAA